MQSSAMRRLFGALLDNTLSQGQMLHQARRVVHGNAVQR